MSGSADMERIEFGRPQKALESAVAVESKISESVTIFKTVESKISESGRRNLPACAHLLHRITNQDVFLGLATFQVAAVFGN